jgi:hypothetical protein
LKLHAALLIKRKLEQLGYRVRLEHQDGCPEHSHYYLTTNVPNFSVWKNFRKPGKYTFLLNKNWCFSTVKTWQRWARQHLPPSFLNYWLYDLLVQDIQYPLHHTWTCK